MRACNSILTVVWKRIPTNNHSGADHHEQPTTQGKACGRSLPASPLLYASRIGVWFP